MKLKKCFHCNKIGYTPIHITEIAKDKSVYNFDLCQKCGENFSQVHKKQLDISHIKTPQQLLEFITGMSHIVSSFRTPCPECGWTSEEFDNKGRFGCSKCYEHFTDKIEQLVFPYHKANSHQGKVPKNYMKNLCNSSVEEKTKLLKLQLAKAIELEEYEKAAQIKIELCQMNPLSSEGQ